MTQIARLADEFAQQRLATSTLEGVDTALALDIWRHQAMEVLAFAIPRLGVNPDSTNPQP